VRDSSILENNIVQTVASAAGTLSAIIFVLPGLVIVGWWVEFPFWTSMLVCTSGGILGVLFTIPLRRALVTTSDLPYPEGVAAAEVLKVGSATRGETDDRAGSREGLAALILGSSAAALLAVAAAARIAAAGITRIVAVTPRIATGYDIAFSLALVGAGHLVGLSVGLAMLLGLLIAWAGGVPILTYLQPAPPGVEFAEHAETIWRTQVRFLGAGTIGIAAMWTLAKLARPVVGGLVSTLSASRAAAAAVETDRDLAPTWILGLTAACLLLAGWLAAQFLSSTPLAGTTVMLTAFAVPFILIVGFLIAAICGYMAGLIGASNSPISGVGILSIVLCASLLSVFVAPSPDSRPALIAFALLVTAIIFACATISNDNLQDLKTGQLVGAAPWRQQIALIVGVGAGAMVIPPVLNLLARAYGFAGAPNVNVVAENPLPAPQATLISALAQGVIGGNLDWQMIGVGVLVGVGVIFLDEMLRLARRMAMPPLAVGIGIYLPMSATFGVVLGAVVGHWYERRAARMPAPERAQRLGVLVASGLIVGESLFGVINAGLIVASSNEAPLAVVPADFPLANAIGIGAFVAIIVLLYRWMLQRARAAKPA
jgi:putative OPT family oligopeptide transporter